MNRYCGFHQGLYGDIAMGTVAARIVKKHDPGCHFTMIVGADFAPIEPLLRHNPWVDRVHVTHKGRDGFDEVDRQWLDSQQFTYVFDPMADHNHGVPWWLYRSQPLELVYMHGLPHDGESPKIQLTKWFDIMQGYEKHIAFAPFAGFYDPSNDKRFLESRAQEIVNALVARGYRVRQIGAPNEPRLEGADYSPTSYFDSVRTILGCAAFLTTDTGLTWVTSAYDMPTVGCYSHRYYGAQFVHNIQPLNDNAVYLDAPCVNDLDVNTICDNIEGVVARHRLL